MYIRSVSVAKTSHCTVYSLSLSLSLTHTHTHTHTCTHTLHTPPHFLSFSLSLSTSPVLKLLVLVAPCVFDNLTISVSFSMYNVNRFVPGKCPGTCFGRVNGECPFPGKHPKFVQLHIASPHVIPGQPSNSVV